MEIKVPFLKEPVGAGDMVKAATSSIGIQPCTPCEERRRRMNAALRFIPQAQWTKPPDVPEGWTRETAFEVEGGPRLEMFSHTSSGKLIIWHVIEGRYERSHTFCCGEKMRGAVAGKWEELCAHSDVSVQAVPLLRIVGSDLREVMTDSQIGTPAIRIFSFGFLCG
jgi:hypothetical protein